MVHLISSGALTSINPRWWDQFWAAIFGESDHPFSLVYLIVME
jgi:hypothetical protein